MKQARRACLFLAVALGIGGPFSFGSGAVAAQEPSEAGNRQYRAAAELQRGGQFELAVAAWNDFLAKNRDHAYAPQAMLNLGVCYLKSKQYDKALVTLRQTLKDYPEASFREAAYLYLGVAEFSMGRAGQTEQYLESRKTLDALLRQYPEGQYLPQALYYRAECDYALGNKEAAARLYERIVREFPKSGLLPEALYALGVAQEELGLFQAAGTTYERFLAVAGKHPLSVEVTMRRGETLFGLGQYEAAAGRFGKAAESVGFRLADHALMRQAASLAQAKQYARAAELYATLAKRFPSSSRVEAAQLAAGKCYYLANEWAKSLDLLSRVTAARGESLPEAVHWSARSLLKQGKPEEAISLLERRLSEAAGSPTEAQLRLDLADASREIPKLRNISITLYADVVKKFPNDAVADSALYMAAFTALEQGDYATATTYAEQFLESYPSSKLLPDVVALAAESDLQLGRLDESQRRYQDLIQRDPGHPEVPTWRLRRGLIFYLQKKYPLAIGSIQPIVNRLASQTDRAEAYYLLGSCFGRQQRFDEAADALRLSLLSDANSPWADDAMLMLADVLRNQGDLVMAKETIERLMKTFPKSVLLDQAHYWLAEAAYNDGDLASAEREYQDLIRSWPKSRLMPQALFGLAWTQISRENYTAAQDALDRLIAEFPKSELIGRARFARGAARQQLGRFAEAAEDVGAMLATKPKGKEKSDALYVLGLCQAGMNQNAEAVATFETLLKEDPKYSGADKAIYELAWALKGAGKSDEAGRRFEELASRFPKSPLAAECLYHVAEIQYDDKRYGKAVDAYRNAADKTADPSIKEKSLHKLAWSYFKQNQFGAAAKAFAEQRKAFAEGRLAADAAFMEAECLSAEGKTAQALQAYEIMLALPQKPLGDDFRAFAFLHAAQAAERLKQPEKSLSLLSRAAGDLPDSPHLPEVLFEQAQVERELGRLDDAARHYAEAAGKTTREVAARAQLMLGRIQAQQKKHTEAIRTFYEVLYGGQDFPRWQSEAAFEAAQCFEAIGKKDQALKLYGELLQKFPKSDKAADAQNRLDALKK